MANPVVGAAFIEVHADTSPFARELGPEVEAIMKGIQPVAEKSGEKVGGKLGDGVKKGAKKKLKGFWREIGDVLDKNARRDQNILLASARSIGSSFGIVLRRSATRVLGKGFVREISKIFDKDARGNRHLFRHTGVSLGKAVLAGVQSGFKGIGGLVTSIGSSIGNVGAKSPLAPIVGGGILLLLPAILGLISLLINQLGALVNVIGLLPGVVFGAVAAIVPLVVAFQGFGEAISAIMDGDPEKINEALKKLSPSARGVAREFQKMLPFFHELRLFTQEAFFSKIGGSLTKLIKSLGPVLKGGFGSVAGAAGGVFKQLGDMLGSPATQAFLKDLFAFASRTIATLGPSLIRFLAALMAVAGGSLPTLDKIVDKFSKLLDSFSKFLTDSVENGGLQNFFDKMGSAVSQLVRLAKTGWHLVDAILSGTDKDGKSFRMFDRIIQAIDMLTEFFKSKEGQKGLEGMVTLAGTFVALLLAAVVALSEIAAIYQHIIDMVNWLIQHSPWGTKNTLEARARDIQKTTSATQGHADGVISTKEHVATISEGNKAEAVIPLTDPARAQQLADESGLTQMLSGSQGNVYVYIGDEQVKARVVRWSAGVLKQFSKNMRYGPRTVGVGGA